MNWKWTAFFSGAGLVATWLGSTSVPYPQSAVVAPAAAPTAVSPSARDIEEQAAHLQAALRAHAEYRPPTRNPFIFAQRPRTVIAAPAHLQPADQLPIVPAEPVHPLIRLSGIASDAVDGGVQRTAVLSTSADVLLLKEGESGAGYTVRKIDEDAVELVGPDGSPLRLTFRP